LTALQGTLQTNLAPLWAGLDKTMALRLVMTALVLLLIWFSRALALRWIKHKPDTTPGRFFSWKKTTFYIAFGLTVLVIMQLWTESLQLFFTFLGLVAAALVITLKEPFMSLAGALFILWRKPFGVGDRIEIDGRKGDVIDISFFRFLMVEVGNWVKGDQSTGGILHLPNLLVFTKPLVNYSQGMHYVWNELMLHLTLDSDWEKAKAVLQQIALQELSEIAAEAKLELAKASEEYLIVYKNLTPIVYVKVWEKSIDLTLRYLCAPRQRRATESKLWELILKQFQQDPTVKFKEI